MSLVLCELSLAGVALLRINRPARRNALSMDVRQELAAHIHRQSENEAVRCIVITGDERAFAAGADVDELLVRTPIHPDFARGRVCFTAIEQCAKPVIAAVNGFALGAGCELAMHCDIVISGREAQFGQPEVRLGIMPGAGGTQRFLRAAGKFAAMRWLLTGDILSAEDAFRIGLISEVVDAAEALPHALSLASRIAALAPLAVGAIKEAIITGADVPLPSALLLERKAFQLLFATADKDEGIKAFREKRVPRFEGK